MEVVEEGIYLVKDGYITPVKVDRYPDGVPMVKLGPAVMIEGQDLLLTSPVLLPTAMFLADAFEERGIDLRNLILPFIPGARQDRLNEEGDFLFTMKSVAQMINQRGFHRVVVLDPHSTVATALIDRCEVFPFTRIFMDSKFDYAHNYYQGVIAPDAGAVKRAEMAACVLGVPVLQASKKRDVQTGKLLGFEAPKLIPGYRYLIVDDICDGGGTFLGLSAVLAQWQVTVDLYVTHGIFSHGTKELCERFQRIITTDSFPFGPREGVITIPIVKEMVNYV